MTVTRPANSSRHEKKLREAVRAQTLKFASEDTPIASLDGKTARKWIFDFRAIMCDSEYLDAYAELFWDRFEHKFPFQICGIESAGIALVAAIVMKGRARGKKVSGLYVRKERKSSGLMKAIEGTLTMEPVIMVDDVMNSGASLRRALAVLQNAGLRTTDVFTILSLQRDVSKILSDVPDITAHTLFTAEEFGILPSESIRDTHAFEVVWKFSSQKPGFNTIVPKSAPVLSDGSVFNGSDSGIMRAINEENGDLLWEYQTHAIPFGKGIFSTPAIHDDKIFFGAYDGNVYALQKHDGKRTWVYRDADWVGSSPAVASDLGLLFIGLEYGLFRKRGGIVALSLEGGKEQWLYRNMPSFTHSSPLYIREERLVVIGSNDGVVYCLNAKNGSLLWTFATDGSVKASFAYDPKKRRVVFGSFDGNVYALEARTGELLWRFDAHEAFYSTPCIKDRVAYIGCLNKYLYALSLDSGEELWHVQTRGRIYASPVIGLDALWIGSNDGCLYEIDPRTGSVRARFQTGERIVNAVAVNEKKERIFLPTDANELYCLRRTPLRSDP